MREIAISMQLTSDGWTCVVANGAEETTVYGSTPKHALHNALPYIEADLCEPEGTPLARRLAASLKAVK